MKQSIRVLPLAALATHPANVREDVGDLSELASSILAHGILQPLVVTEHPTVPDRWLILAGHRRPVVADPAYLTKRHPLAGAVKAACTHTTRPKVGGVGCGQCFEQVIRADERAKAAPS